MKSQTIAPVAALESRKRKTKRKTKKAELFARQVLVQLKEGSALLVFDCQASAALFRASETSGGLRRTEAGQFHGVGTPSSLALLVVRRGVLGFEELKPCSSTVLVRRAVWRCWL